MIVHKFSKNMKILFVGINPHPGSFNRGVPFSNNKMFWYILNRSGAINENIELLKNDKSLKEIYDKKFNQVYKLGIVNIISRPTKDVSLLKKGEEISGRKDILSIIKKYNPKIVCFVGKVTFQKFSGQKNISFGWSDDIFKSKSFILHFPIRGEAKIRVD